MAHYVLIIDNRGEKEVFLLNEKSTDSAIVHSSSRMRGSLLPAQLFQCDTGSDTPGAVVWSYPETIEEDEEDWLDEEDEELYEDEEDSDDEEEDDEY